MLARELGLSNKKSTEEMVNNLFGLFFAIFHVNIVFGSIISSTVIGDGFPSFSDLGNTNQTEVNSLRAKCGINQVNEPSSCEAGAIDDQTLYLLMGIYSGIMFVSILMIIFAVEDFDVEPLDENFRKGCQCFP